MKKIEIMYQNGIAEAVQNVDHWYLNTNGKIPLLMIEETITFFGSGANGTKTKVVNLFNVLSFQVIEDVDIEDTSSE